MQRARVAMVTASLMRWSGSDSRTFRIRRRSSESGGHTRRICDMVRLLRRDAGAPSWLSGTSARPAGSRTMLPLIVRASGARVMATMPPSLPPSSQANSAACRLFWSRPVPTFEKDMDGC